MIPRVRKVHQKGDPPFGGSLGRGTYIVVKQPFHDWGLSIGRKEAKEKEKKPKKGPRLTPAEQIAQKGRVDVLVSIIVVGELQSKPD